MEGVWVFCREMGLGVTLAIAIFVAFWFLLKWVLETAKEMIIKMNEERVKYIDIIGEFHICIREHTESAKAFQSVVAEAHRHQREEHVKMVENQIAISKCLAEVEHSLGRINGYK